MVLYKRHYPLLGEALSPRSQGLGDMLTARRRMALYQAPCGASPRLRIGGERLISFTAPEGARLAVLLVIED